MEGENDVVGSECGAIGKLNPSAELNDVAHSVWRNSPRFCQRWFGTLSVAIDVDQIRIHCADDFTGLGVDGKDWVKGFGISTKCDDKCTARLSHISFFNGKILSCRWLCR